MTIIISGMTTASGAMGTAVNNYDGTIKIDTNAMHSHTFSAELDLPSREDLLTLLREEIAVLQDQLDELWSVVREAGLA